MLIIGLVIGGYVLIALFMLAAFVEGGGGWELLDASEVWSSIFWPVTLLILIIGGIAGISFWRPIGRAIWWFLTRPYASMMYLAQRNIEREERNRVPRATVVPKE